MVEKKNKKTGKKQQGWRSWKPASLVIALVVVVGGTILFVGAAAGWFSDNKVVLDEEYYSEDAGLVDLTTEEYEELVKSQKSFVVLVDQGGCTTADRLRGYVEDWAKSVGVKVYRMMFDEMKKTSLHDYVKY